MKGKKHEPKQIIKKLREATTMIHRVARYSQARRLAEHGGDSSLGAHEAIPCEANCRVVQPPFESAPSTNSARSIQVDPINTRTTSRSGIALLLLWLLASPTFAHPPDARTMPRRTAMQCCCQS